MSTPEIQKVVLQVTVEQNSLTGWMLAGIASVIATLTSTVAWLFKLRENENAKHIEGLKNEVATISAKADKCEVERGDLKTECALMRGKIDVLETKLAFIDVNGTKYAHKDDKKA
jgi:hypothetical protein